VSTEDPGRDSNLQPINLAHHETIAELRALPDAELERRHDVAEQTVTSTRDAQERLLYIERALAFTAPSWSSARVSGRRRGWKR
jgi:hypothetical protein